MPTCAAGDDRVPTALRSHREAQRCSGALNKAKLRRELVGLRSEVDAIVQSVAKVSVGSVLQSGQQFITLVPYDAPLEMRPIFPAATMDLCISTIRW
jgi:hypothetical protein